MIKVFTSLLTFSRFFKFHDGWDNLHYQNGIDVGMTLLEAFLPVRLRFVCLISA